MPAPATPTPAIATTVSNGVLLGGRTSVALQEVIRRLSTEVGPLIASENARLGLTGNAAWLNFDRYDVAPYLPSRSHANECLVKIHADFTPQGPRAFRRADTLSIFLIEGKWTAGAQFLAALDRSELVLKVLHNYLTGCVDPLGRNAWRTLCPKTQGELPDEWREYAGIRLDYDLFQSAGDDLWSA